jgi:hypothetical protein
MHCDFTLALVLSAFIRVHLSCLSAVQAVRPAHERIAALVETQRAMSFLGDADAYAYTDSPRWTRGCSEPKLARTAEVNSIKLSRDPKCFGETSWPARKVNHALRVAMALHSFDAFERLDSSKQHAFSDAFALAGNVEHVMIAVHKIDVRVSAFEE